MGVKICPCGEPGCRPCPWKGVPYLYPGMVRPHKPVLPADANFDGAAVKQNWIPLVVLGLSLVVGIGLSEWATKKYIK